MAVINTTVAFASEQATVSSTALTLDTFGFTTEQVQQAERAYIFVNSESIRCWWDGSVPTTTDGVLVEVGLELTNENLRKFQMIRNSTTDSQVAVVLEK